MRTKESSEMYLEVILELEQRNKTVRSVDIANELNYTKPSVSRAMGLLRDQGLITQPPYGEITLTDKGRKKAQEILNRHKLITRFLIKTLNIAEHVAEEDACRIEHIISPDTMDAMKVFMDKAE